MKTDLSKWAIGMALAACVCVSIENMCLRRKCDHMQEQLGDHLQLIREWKVTIGCIQDAQDSLLALEQQQTRITETIIDRVRECQDAVGIKRAAELDRGPFVPFELPKEPEIKLPFEYKVVP